MFRLILFLLISVSLQIYSQEVPEVIWENDYEVIYENDTIPLLGHNCFIQKIEDNFWIGYNAYTKTGNIFAIRGIMSIDVEGNENIKFTERIITNRPFLFVTQADVGISILTHEKNKESVAYPLLNRYDKNGNRLNNISGDTEERNYNYIATLLENDKFYILADKKEINGNDTIESFHFDIYNENLEFLSTSELDTSGFALPDNFALGDFAILDNDEFVLCNKGPFLDFFLGNKWGTVTKFNAEGKIDWSDLIYTNKSARMQNVNVLPSGNIAAGGVTVDSSGTGYHYSILYNAEGTRLWEKQYESARLTQFNRYMKPIKNGEYFVSYGRITDQFTLNSENMMLIFDENGELINSFKWGVENSKNNIFGVEYLEDEDSFIVLSAVNETKFKISKISANITSVVEAKQIPLKLFPNPAKDEFTLDFSTAKAGSAKIYITDVLGNNMAVLYDDFITAGSNSFTFSLPKSISSGSYYVTLEMKGVKHTEAVKIVK